jgi:cation transport ATPase
MKKSIIFIALAVFSNMSFATTSIRAEVKGMVCAFCAQGIEKKFKNMSQTQGVFVDLKKRIVAVELKDKQTLATEDFTKIIHDAGYEVSKVEQVEQSLADIKAELGANARGSK